MVNLEHAPVVVKKPDLTSRWRSYVPFRMKGWIGGRRLVFCDVCRELRQTTNVFARHWRD
jgi:hypothetical protein